MVFVKVRETYDLHTVQNKMTMIGIHTPRAQIIKDNYPGLLMQCKAYRPVSCDVTIACASMLPADPLQVSTAAGDIAPEDLFNPILYKACSNIGMSQIEARILTEGYSTLQVKEAEGQTAFADNNSVSTQDDEFDLYYGLLSDTNQWRHASPQSGLSMKGLKPMVCEMLYSPGDNRAIPSDYGNSPSTTFGGINQDDTAITGGKQGVSFRGNFKPMPMINTTSFSTTGAAGTNAVVGFPRNPAVVNAEVDVPAPKIFVGCIIVPPSRLHQLFYRMVVEWTLEFSSIRSLHEITSMLGLSRLGASSHYQTYSYEAAKAVSGVEESLVDKDTSMVSSNVDINKVM